MLGAARAAFAERGYDGASIRAIATAAGVDPALVHHYFGNKDKLFLAAIEAPADPDDFLPGVLARPREEMGENIVRMLLHVWDGPAQPAGLALLRSAVSSEWSAKLLREFLTARVIRRVIGSLGYPPAERDARGALVATQLVGLVMVRYVLRLDPVASATPDELAVSIGPNLQRYLTGEVELPGKSVPGG